MSQEQQTTARTDAELAEYWKHQTIHYRNLANTYLQQLLALKNKPERHYGKTTLHRDPTGTAAVNAVEKERRNSKGQP
ncbi:hypothetical protein J7I84_14645 [Arthrobacter sp. ISL-85]|uniref:hypothetical protein n=1 Tax=Arthrobacter sp. ISL-85 TaxID=2819115 RepID=UPI001BE8A448|nr:hypothetical protein [Arthrobacter sp. ISL-85]MBT2567715.1 hypothetical protein [Arthrobacter sp. ISL-85]